MWKKILISLLVLTIGVGAIVWFNRAALINHVVLNRVKANKFEVAEHRPVEWDKGPSTTDLPPEERPPNIVFILFDDLGINDISTFGGGVAGGKVPTPNIDRLAADGALFTQAYSGTGTCAPSRAMLMTGRYPTRTGFEFTPIVEGMGRVVSTIANSMDTGILPRSITTAIQTPPSCLLRSRVFPAPRSRLQSSCVIRATTPYTSANGTSAGTRKWVPTHRALMKACLCKAGFSCRRMIPVL